MPNKLLMAATALLLTAGCTGLSKKIDGNIDETNTKASTLVREIGRAVPGAAAESTPAVVRETGIWLGRNAIKLGARPLPPIFYEPATFDRTVTSLTELAERFTLRSGIPTKVTQEALALGMPGAPGLVAAAAAAAGTAPAAAPVPLPPRPAPIALSNSGAANQGMAVTPIRIMYANGNFKGLLDTAAARFGVSWKYEDGVIQFFHTDSRTFQINAIPGDSTFNANVGSGASSTGGRGGGGGGGGGGSGGGGGGSSGGVTSNNNQTTAVASKLSVYTSIESAVRTMLSPYGRVSASPGTGAITVVDTPENLDRISAYIDSENKTLSRQVVVNVTVLSVSLSDNDEYGINWNLVYTTLNRQYGMKNILAASTDSTAFSASILGSANLSGSTAVINALSKQGKVRRQTTASVVTLNNQPVPVQVARETTYLQSSQTTVVAQVGSTTSLTPGTVTSGFNMSILPHVLTNGTVMLQFSTDISTLRQIRPVTSNGTLIETPEMDTRNFLQRVAMKSNETLIISGFEQTDENLDKQGVGKPNNYAMGGGYKANANKEVIVILITPTVVAGS